jgi:hypothetical protein
MSEAQKHLILERRRFSASGMRYQPFTVARKGIWKAAEMRGGPWAVLTAIFNARAIARPWVLYVLKFDTI